MLVVFPLGLFLTAVIFDVIHLVRGGPIWSIVAYWMIGALVLVTGWLGGELVDRLGVGVDDGANLNSPSSLSTKAAKPSGANRVPLHCHIRSPADLAARLETRE
jgi:hypothetical protein